MCKEYEMELKIIALGIIHDKLYYMDFPEYYKGIMDYEDIEYIKNEINKINEKIRLKKDKLISKRNRDE